MVSVLLKPKLMKAAITLNHLNAGAVLAAIPVVWDASHLLGAFIVTMQALNSLFIYLAKRKNEKNN